MRAHFLLWIAGLFVASFVTAMSSRSLENRRPDWPLWLRLVLASMALPIGWAALHAVILPVILHKADVQAGFGSLWPKYLREVVLGIGLKLWACGALCAGFLWITQFRSSGSAETSWIGYKGLWLLCLGCAAAITLAVGMPFWIETGHMRGSGLVLVPYAGFCVGFVPAYAVALSLFQLYGTVGMQWIGRFAGFYAAAICVGGMVWYQTASNRAGAWSILLVSGPAILGVLVAWTLSRLASRASSEAVAAALLASDGRRSRGKPPSG